MDRSRAGTSTQAAEQSACLRARLGQLALPLGVRNDAGTRSKFNLFAMQRHTADQNVEVHRAVVIDETQRAGVGLTRLGLQFSDDLHATELRTARNRASGED